jgi:hypothetical protein
LIRLGLRLRDLGEPWFTWEDLRAIIYGVQRDTKSMTALDVHGPEALTWDPQLQLLAGIFDSLQLLEYRQRQQLFKDPGEVPDPLPRPGVKSQRQQWAGPPRTIEDMDRLLGWNQN